MKTALATSVLLVSLLSGTGGTGALAGFSDNLVGKGKPPGGQQEVNRPSAEKGQAPIESLSQQQPVSKGVDTGTAQGSFDVAGLKLGMSQDDVVTAVQARRRELNGKPITFEIVKEGTHQVLVQGAVPRTRFVALSDARSVLSAFDISEELSKNPSNAQDPRVQQFAALGQIEVFEFQFPNVPNEARASAITRLQRLAPPVHFDTVRTALVKKYGPPTIDGKIIMFWLVDTTGAPVAAQDLAKCRGFVPPPGTPVGEFDYSVLALKGCGEQLTVQLQGALDMVMLIQTTLYHHQRLVDAREATQKAALSRFGLAPEQTKQAPAPQF